MRNFGTLFFYEVKKILQRRLAQATLVIMVLIGLFMGAMPLFATENSGGSYARLVRQREAAAALNGRPLDDAMLGELRAVYAGLSDEDDWVLPLDDPDLAYSDVYGLVWSCVGQENILTTDAAGLYARLHERQEQHMAAQGLTAGETAWWRQQAAQVEQPIQYWYCLGPVQLYSSYYTLGVFLVLLAAVCLAGLFADERQRRTDQLLLSSRMGRRTLYLAKLAAGAAVSLGGALALLLSVLLPLAAVYGLDGWNSPYQLDIPYTPLRITLGQVFRAFLWVYLAAALLLGAAAMFFSEVFQNSLASMALLISGMMLSLMLPVPDHIRPLAQIMEMLPNELLAPWSMANYRLLPWFGGYLTELQAAPALYLAAAALMAALGWLHYRRSQVSGR